MHAFTALAPYLTNPLTLVGFALFLAFGVHRALIRSKIIPPLRQKDAPAIVRLLLAYGFWISIVVIVAGFGYTALTSIHKDISLLREKTSTLELVDSYLERADNGDNILNVKLRNTGSGDAFIFEVRFLQNPNSIKTSLWCSLVKPDEFNFSSGVIYNNSTFPLEFEKDALSQKYIINLLAAHPDISTDYILSHPLKISATVPSGGVEWMKFRFPRSVEKSGAISSDASISPACFIVVESPLTMLVAAYDNGSYILTNPFRLGQQLRDRS
jgi:hypothetical protein